MLTIKHRCHCQLLGHDAGRVSDAEVGEFERSGYLVVRGLLSGEEVDRLRTGLQSSSDIARHAYGRSDGMGASSKEPARLRSVACSISNPKQRCLTRCRCVFGQLPGTT